MTEDLLDLDAIGQAELVARGRVSALELVDAAIARIEKLEPAVHALVSTDFAAARKRAATRPSGPLGGVPFLIKDLLSYPGQRFTIGARLFRDQVATAGSPYTERLDGAGLVTLGKTTTSELGLLGSTEALLCGFTHNPWDPSRSAAGSSGGAAAAVASGMVPMAHGSDGGGSIRIPGSVCGVFGFKPGRNRCVPSGQVDPGNLLVDHCVSRSVRDSALLLSITEDTSGAAGPPVGFVNRPIDRKLRIGVYTTTLMGRAPDPDVLAALERTSALCAELGHEIIESPPPPVDGAAISEAFFTWAGASLSEVLRMMEAIFGRTMGEEDFEPFTFSLVAWYREQPEGALARAYAALEREGAHMREHMAGYDVLLCPTLPIAPPELGMLSPTLDREVLIHRTELLAGYTPIHNIAGLPAMSVPLFTSSTGLPLGSHFAAGPSQEATLLGLALQLEAAAPWKGRWPALTRERLGRT